MGYEVTRGASLGAQVAEALRRRIVAGDLPPGARITEEGLAEEFAVSRGPVREAITQLSFEKLVEVRRPRGIYVVGLTDDDVDQLYSLRGALEQLALARAMRVLDQGRWHPMRVAVSRMTVAAHDRNRPEFLRADLDFHSQIYALADHPRLEEVWHQYLLPTFAALQNVTVIQDDDLRITAADHERLMEVMHSGSVDRASAELTEHLRISCNRMHGALDDRNR